MIHPVPRPQGPGAPRRPRAPVAQGTGPAAAVYGAPQPDELIQVPTPPEPLIDVTSEAYRAWKAQRDNRRRRGVRVPGQED